MVSSAVYRYFPSRDELLTALIVDAYDAVGAAAEEALAAHRRRGAGARWLAVSQAIRAWALAHPHEYALIYGSPVPGYAAPPDTIDPRRAVAFALLQIVVDGVANRRDRRGRREQRCRASCTPTSPALRDRRARRFRCRAVARCWRGRSCSGASASRCSATCTT